MPVTYLVSHSGEKIVFVRVFTKDAQYKTHVEWIFLPLFGRNGSVEHPMPQFSDILSPLFILPT